MSNTNRRRSRTLRLTLAAVALLGIGAAITAAAWQDDVFVDVAVSSSSMNLQGQVTIDGIPSGWQESDGSGVNLKIDLPNLTPGDSHDVTIALRNQGTTPAYVTYDDSNLVPGDALGDCEFGLSGDDIAFDVVPAGGTPVQGTLTLTADPDSNWDYDLCQGKTFATGYLVYHATSDAPTP